MTDGYVRTNCAHCGQPQRVLVHFPSFNVGFESRIYMCTECSCINILEDKHIYSPTGEIIGEEEIEQ